MWHNGIGAEIAVQCPHCGARDWRRPDELRVGRLICFACARLSIWPSELGRSSADPATGRIGS